MGMSTRAWYAVVGGGILVIIGLFAMRFPVYLDEFDQWGWQVKCGTGLSADLTQAGLTTNADHFVSDCETAVLLRRMWTVPLVVIGAYSFFATLLATALRSLREEALATTSGN